MSIAVKSAIAEIVNELRASAHAFICKRSTQTHALAFVLGLLIGIVGLRWSVKSVEVEPSEPVITVVEATPKEAPATEHQTNYDAVCIARVLYGIRGYNLSDNAKTAVIEVIKNRVADTACEFRNVNTIQEVCEQPNQWQGYVSDGEYLKEDYDLALRVLEDTSGARTIPEGCYFLVVKSGVVTVRTKWDGGNEWSVK